MVYRSDKTLKFRQSLEQLAEEEAELLEQAAQDLELRSQGQAAEVRLRTRDLGDLEGDDLEEARECAKVLIQQTEKSALERKERWKQRKKLGYKIMGITAAVLSLAYGISRIPAVRATYDSEYAVRYALEEQLERQLEEQVEETRKEHAVQYALERQSEERIEETEERLQKAANSDCTGYVSVKDFYAFYKDAIGKDFPNTNLHPDGEVNFKIEPAAKSVSIESSNWTRLTYEITLPLQTAKELLQKKNSCEF